MPTAPALSRSRLDFLLDNPILRYEGVPRFLRRKRLGGWRFALPVGLVGSAVCGMALVAYEPELASGLSLVLGMLWGTVTAFAPAVQTSRAIIWERQRGSWDGLLMSRLRPADIVLGKLLGALLPFWVAGLLLAPLLIITTYASAVPLTFFERSDLPARYLSAFAISAAFASIGLWLSLRSRAESSAQFQMLMVIAGSYLVSRVAAIFFAAFLTDGMPTEGLAELLQLAALCSPGALALADLLRRFRTLERLGRK